MFETSIRSYLKQSNYPRFELKAVLFDMDGVLFDSMPLHSQAWIQAFKEWNIPFTEEEAYLHEGRTGSGTINIVFQQRLGRHATPEEIKAIYKRNHPFLIRLPGPVMEGANELLDLVRDSGLNRIW
jgi:beta-phosphoglucomutase-like phosphatase (HAD superfamily)